ncbi:dihydrofolate reductase family protein [Agromyces cerinus]|uniref:Dihydrofolate reductase n=1 Tax=Agromyces cerinus subsp. cerinus TaxID=232089 RepID=A0A1N6I3Q3_9MICO|nr:dihydrofolate reductase family protein [Agromyces cerinus]SIO26623.1 Dihydrofolate reductase [Agromyces cerinus subsp. cerinus]
MGVIVVDLFVTLDGVYQSPGSRDEDTEGGFPFGGWQGAYTDAESGAAIGANIERVDALLLGRKTYDIWAAYWPFQSDDIPIAARFNAVPKFVASHSLTDPSWAGTTVVTEVAAEVRGIRDRFDETHVVGSGDLVRTLLREDLVDRINLWLYPIALGTGKRLFAEGTVPAAFALVEPPLAFPKGSVQLVYERAGEPVTGVDMSTVDEAGA